MDGGQIAAAPTIGVVGAGYWGKNLVRNFAALGALGMVCDANPETLAALAERYPGVETTPAFPDLLNHPGLQGVVVASPAATHGDLVREALLAGKDVFVEKPLCLSEQEGAGLVALAEKQERILMVGHLLWYHPGVLALQELVASGKLGRLRYIYSNRLNLGKLRREENVLWSFAPHDFSVILGLCGETPESVIAQGGHYLHRRIADTTVTQLRFPSGVQAHVFVSWLHPFKEQKLVVVGEKQMAVFDDTAPWAEKLALFPHTIEWRGQVPLASKAEGQFVPLPESEPLRGECQHFLDCVRTRQRPRTDGAEGVRVLSLLSACQRSMESGAPVIPQMEGSEGLSGMTAAKGTDAAAEPAYFVHETAVVDADVEIGRGSRIWHFAHLLSHSRVGARCSIGQNVAIGPRVAIGDGCKVQNNVSLYQGVTLEDDVFCGPSMVFTNVHNPRAHVSRKSEFRSTLVRRGATIGANATIVCGVTLGRYCFIGAGAVVTRDVADFALMAGNPARRIGWMSHHGERLALPPSGQGVAACPATGRRYRLQGETLTALD